MWEKLPSSYFCLDIKLRNDYPEGNGITYVNDGFYYVVETGSFKVFIFKKMDP